MQPVWNLTYRSGKTALVLSTRRSQESLLIRYRRLRTAVQLNAAPERPARLRELEGRLRAALLDTGMFLAVEAGHTTDADRLVIALCHFGPTVPEAAVARALSVLWQEKLRYPLWESHAVLVEEGHVELQGATRGTTSGPYVTVHVVAQRARVPHQRAPLN